MNETLLIEYTADREDGGDIYLPYIKAFLNQNNERSIFIRTDNIKLCKDIIFRLKPKLIITNNKKAIEGLQIQCIEGASFADYMFKTHNRKIDIFKQVPVYEADITEEREESKYIPSLVLSNTSNKTRSDGELIYNRGCCCHRELSIEPYTGNRWRINSNEDLKRAILALIEFLRLKGLIEFRIIGEYYLKRPDLLMSLLKELNIRGVIVSFSPDMKTYIDSAGRYETALKIAEKGQNFIRLKAIDIKNFYRPDLLFYRSKFNSLDIITGALRIYKMMELFKYTLLIKENELFRYILFHPYTTVESLRYNLEMMSILGVDELDREGFLNSLIIRKDSHLYSAIKSDGLIEDGRYWLFKNNEISQYYRWISGIEGRFLNINLLIGLLEKYG